MRALVSGNALTVLFDSLSSANNLRIRPYEYDTTLAAKLTIDYTASGGGGITMHSMYYARVREG